MNRSDRRQQAHERLPDGTEKRPHRYAESGGHECLRHEVARDLEAHDRPRGPGQPELGVWHEGQPCLFAPRTGFVVLPNRWVVERTSAWNDRPRRLNRDHDRRPDVSGAWIWFAEGRMLTRGVTAATKVI